MEIKRTTATRRTSLSLKSVPTAPSSPIDPIEMATLERRTSVLLIQALVKPNRGQRPHLNLVVGVGEVILAILDKLHGWKHHDPVNICKILGTFRRYEDSLENSWCSVVVLLNVCVSIGLMCNIFVAKASQRLKLHAVVAQSLCNRTRC